MVVPGDTSIHPVLLLTFQNTATVHMGVFIPSQKCLR